jgi:hypothetical protein
MARQKLHAYTMYKAFQTYVGAKTVKKLASALGACPVNKA